MIPYRQLSLADIFTDCQEKFGNNKPAFLSLLETHIDIDEIIPISFQNHFYASDLILAGIAQLITIVLADSIKLRYKIVNEHCEFRNYLFIL